MTTSLPASGVIIGAMEADDSHPFLLASASPRRSRLLRWLCIPYEVAPVDIDESLDDPRAGTSEDLATLLAEDKALAAGERGRESVILAFDTIVVHDAEVMGKPVDRADARRMLEALSGRTHRVVTGCALLFPGQDRPRSFAVSTPVHMRRLSDADLERWLAGDEVLGCAGAYNIERHLAFVEPDQCFQNVAGLPLCHLYRELLSTRSDLPVVPCSPVTSCDSARGITCALGPRIVGEDTR